MSNARFILLSLMALATLALAAQMVIDFSAVNIGSACIVFASSIAMLLYLLWTPALHTHPLSTFALFGFCVTTQMGALLGQTVFGTSLAQNLRQPLETFATLAGFQVIALLAHMLYRWFLHPAPPPSPVAAPLVASPSLIRQLLGKLGLYEAPPTSALWLMGYVGLFAFLISGGSEGTFRKVLDGMRFLTWAPFLIPMYLIQVGPAYCRPRRQYLHLLGFGSLVILLGLAANVRSIMLSGFVTIALFALLTALRSQKPVSGRRCLQLGLLGLVLGAVAIPMTDLATAMVVARKVRGGVSAVDMVKETLYYFQRPELLAQQERMQRDAATLDKYDEYYFENPLLARLMETKFHDNSLYFVSRFSQSDTARLAQTSVDLMWSILPNPALKALGVDVNKRDLEFSMGDYLSHLSQGGPLGGYRTGSMLAQGLALLGIGFAVVYFFACLGVFALLDLLSYRQRSGQVLLSTVGMLSIWKIFQYGLTADALHAWVSLVFRELPQQVFFFVVITTFVRCLGLVFQGGARPDPRATPTAHGFPLRP